MQNYGLDHVFIVIDGNRRYARKAGVSLEESYAMGANKVTQAIKWILGDYNVANLTIFGLSLLNLKGRKAGEILPILDIQEKTFRSWLSDAFFKNIKIEFVGEIKDAEKLRHVTGFSFPKPYLDICAKLEQRPVENPEKTLKILIAYSGKLDALKAHKRFASHILEKQMDLNSAMLDENQYLAGFYEHSGPEVDVIIRTSETRPLSDGPAHLCYFSEFVLINRLWPEIEKKDIDDAINIFHNKDRRLGG